MNPRPRHVTIKRVDSNHAELVAAARGVGADVVDTHIIGQGVPDAVIIFRNRPYLCEFKSPGGTLTDAEKAYALRSRTPVHVVRSVDELLELIGAVAYHAKEGATP